MTYAITLAQVLHVPLIVLAMVLWKKALFSDARRSLVTLLLALTGLALVGGFYSWIVPRFQCMLEDAPQDPLSLYPWLKRLCVVLLVPFTWWKWLAVALVIKELVVQNKTITRAVSLYATMIAGIWAVFLLACVVLLVHIVMICRGHSLWSPEEQLLKACASLGQLFQIGFLVVATASWFKCAPDDHKWSFVTLFAALAGIALVLFGNAIIGRDTTESTATDAFNLVKTVMDIVYPIISWRVALVVGGALMVAGGILKNRRHACLLNIVAVSINSAMGILILALVVMQACVMMKVMMQDSAGGGAL